MTNQDIQNITLESLRDWFKKEKWVRITTSGNIAGPCGTSKNKKNPDRCLPKAKAQSLSKAERAATARKKKAAGKKGKTVVANTKKAKVTRETANPQDGKAAPYGSGYKPIKKMKKETKEAPAGHYFTKSGNLVKGRMSADAKERGARKSDPKDKMRSKVPKVTQYSEMTKEDFRNLIVGTIAELKNEDTIMEKDDRCTRIAKRKYDTWPSAYASGAVVRCRRGEIWKGVSEGYYSNTDLENEIQKYGYDSFEQFFADNPGAEEAVFDFIDQNLARITKEESSEKEHSDTEIKIGDYQTKHYHMCPGAKSLYQGIEDRVDDMDLAVRTAKLQDALFALEMTALEDGATEADLDAAQLIADQIMAMAKMMGLEKEHNYIQGHVDKIKGAIE